MNARRISFGLRTAAASAALGTALLFAAQSFAADTSAQPAPSGQQQAPAEQNAAPAANNDATTNAKSGQKTTPKHKMAATSHSDRVEAWLKNLHAKLKITDAQKQQWDAYAQVLRDNAAQMDQSAQQENELIKARGSEKTMNAVDDLKAYEAMVDAHADRTARYSDGLKKVVPAFESLYASMSDSQKKIADDMFNQARMRHAHREHNKT